MRFPWGDADPSTGARQPRPAAPAARAGGRLPRGAAPCGARQLIGDVWEWTASDFRPYPGFSAFPYREYSEVFFGSDYKVLRGGAFAADPVACRGTFRNWDYPVRRQIFAGLRTRARREAGLMCRHLAYLGEPVDPAVADHRPAARAAGPGLGAAAAAARHRQRRRFGVGWYADGDPAPGQVPPGRADLVRSVLRRRGQGDQEPGRAGGGPVRDRRDRAGSGGRGAVSPRAGGCSAITGPRPAGRAHWPGSPPSCPRTTCSAWRRRCDSARHLGAGAAQAAGRGRPGRGAGRDRGLARRRGPYPAGSTCC